MSEQNEEKPGQSPTTPDAGITPSVTKVKKRKEMNPLTLILLLSGGFFVLFLLISGILFLRTPRGGGAGGAGFFGSGSVGVIEVDGVIMESKKVLDTLDKFSERADIKAVVLRLDSPGGAVAPSQEIYQAVKEYKKPIISSMGSVAASGAYYIACGTKKIFANPGTITGSIGVIMQFANLKKLYEWAKIERYAVKTGRFKDIGAEYKALEPAEREILQGMVDDVLAQFKSAVAEGRKMKPAEVTRIADGRIFSGAQAKKVKLVDELGTLQDAINEAAKLAKIEGKPNVIYPEKRKPGLLELLLSDPEDDYFGGSAFGGGPVRGILGRLLKSGEMPTALRPGLFWIWNGVY